MDKQDSLQAYVRQVFALGQTALALRRRGEWLPLELTLAADELLTLERALSDGQPMGEAPPVARSEPDVAPEPPAATDDLAPLVIDPGTDAGDDWLRPLSAEPDHQLAGSAAEPVTKLVLDLDEEPGGGPAEIDSPLSVLPPLVIDAERDLLPEAVADALIIPPMESAADQPPWLRDEPVASPAAAAPPVLATDELQYCNNCGAELRPGRRFCHRCGTPVPAAFADAPAPESAPYVSLSEQPTYAGAFDSSEIVATPAHEAVRFCNNCGMSVAPGVAACPECGSRDIG